MAMYWDVESQYDYFGARYYDARIGRWLSVDPLHSRGPYRSPYVYSSDSPLWYIDPDGMLERRAAEYAVKNLQGKSYGRGEDYVPKKYPAWEIVDEDQTKCNGLVARAYRDGAGYADYPIEMPDQIGWFKTRGWWTTEGEKGEVGDVMFLGNTNSPGERHELIITGRVDDEKRGTMYTIVQAGNSGSKEYKARYYTVDEIQDKFSGGRAFVGFGSVKQSDTPAPAWFRTWADQMLGTGSSPAQMWQEMHMRQQQVASQDRTRAAN